MEKIVKKVHKFYSGSGGKWNWKHHITKSIQYQDMRIEVFRMLKASDNWITNARMTWEINKLLDIELKPKQISFLLATVRKKEGFNIIVKRSTNPFENPKHKGALNQGRNRSPTSTYPTIRTFYKLIRSSCERCASNRTDAMMPLQDGKKWRCLQCGNRW